MIIIRGRERERPPVNIRTVTTYACYLIYLLHLLTSGEPCLLVSCCRVVVGRGISILLRDQNQAETTEHPPVGICLSQIVAIREPWQSNIRP